MKKKVIVFFSFSLVLALVLAVALSFWATASPVFIDDFSSGDLTKWSRTNISLDASQYVQDEVAHFIVPSPVAGTVTYSAIIKDGFTSTVNSTITASQDILVSKVPYGCPQGNGAIFFFYICDSADLGGNLGNVGVGIDGSSVWSLWIGGNTTYTYIFQTKGPVPVNDTWYHIVLTIDNSAGLVSLAVDNLVVISASQRQFTDRTHEFSLMSGLGEAWWSDCVGSQEVKIDNVRLEISDDDSPISTEYKPTQSMILTLNPTTTSTSTPNPTNTMTPTTTLITPTTTPTTTQVASKDEFPLWLVLSVIVTAVVIGSILLMLKKR
jgi:hypothetical protein